jgi:phage shock protein E
MKEKVSVNKSEIKQMRNGGVPVLLIDVRSETEFDDGHVPDAVNISLATIESADISLKADKATVIVTVCGKGGGRSERAANHLREKAGYQAYFLEGGTFDWFS